MADSQTTMKSQPNEQVAEQLCREFVEKLNEKSNEVNTVAVLNLALQTLTALYIKNFIGMSNHLEVSLPEIESALKHFISTVATKSTEMVKKCLLSPESAIKH